MTFWKKFHTQLQKELIPKWFINEKIDVDLMEFVQTVEDTKNHKIRLMERFKSKLSNKEQDKITWFFFKT